MSRLTRPNRGFSAGAAERLSAARRLRAFGSGLQLRANLTRLVFSTVNIHVQIPGLERLVLGSSKFRAIGYGPGVVTALGQRDDRRGRPGRGGVLGMGRGGPNLSSVFSALSSLLVSPR